MLRELTIPQCQPLGCGIALDLRKARISEGRDNEAVVFAVIRDGHLDDFFGR